MSATPLTAARRWAAAHKSLEAHIHVRRYGTWNERRGCYNRLWTEYYAKEGHVEIDHRAGVCQNCGHVYFGRKFEQFHCPACRTAGALGCAFEDAAYIVTIDTTRETPTVKVEPRGGLVTA